MFEPFQKFLNRSANHYGVGREVKAAQVCHNFRELVTEMFSEQSATFSATSTGPAAHSGLSASEGSSANAPAPHLSSTPRSAARGPLDQFISSGSFQDGLLTVDVASPAWAQEVLMRKPQILEALNRKAGLVIVKNLRTRIKNQS